jgi:hypothetical protein
MFIDLCLKHLELVREINTEYTFVCPICKESKLKVNKESEKYWCYANNCHSADIYKEIIKNDRFYNEDRFKKPKNNIKMNYSIFDHIPITSTTLSRCYIDNSRIYRDREHRQCTYYYNKCLKLVRTDTPEGKVFTPYYKDSFDESWKIGNNGQFNYYLPAKQLDEGIIFCVEGEKCAVDVVERGLTAFSIYQPYSANQTKIREMLSNSLNLAANFLANHGIVYLCDNDRIGLNKGKKFVEVCNYLGIPNQLVTMQDWFTYFSVPFTDIEGYDISDFITDYPDIDMRKLHL